MIRLIRYLLAGVLIAALIVLAAALDGRDTVPGWDSPLTSWAHDRRAA